MEAYVCPKCGGPLTKHVSLRVEMPLSWLAVTKGRLRQSDIKILWMETKDMDITCKKCERVYLLNGLTFAEWKKKWETEKPTGTIK
jgi:hypothetical protein